MWKMYFSREAICILFWNAPKSKTFIFGSFLAFKQVTCCFFEMPRFFMFEYFEMPHFSYFQNEISYFHDTPRKLWSFIFSRRSRYLRLMMTYNESLWSYTLRLMIFYLQRNDRSLKIVYFYHGRKDRFPLYRFCF